MTYAHTAATRGRLLIVVNDPAFLVSHRLPVAIAALTDGYDVHVASPDGSAVDLIKRNGLRHHPIHMERSGMKPWRELSTLLAIHRLFRRLRPDVVHLVTPKPVLYGSIAARFAPVRGVMVAISGLGILFSGTSHTGSLLPWLILRLYRFAFRHDNLRIIFQNSADRQLMVAAGAVQPAQVVMIRGSGVDLRSYVPAPEPTGTPVVTLAARLLGAKGVREFVRAARLLRDRGVPVRFVLAGQPDPGNPESIPTSEVESWAAQGDIEAIGHCSDVSALFAKSHLVVLPSYYAEGIPRVLIEAAACGRAVVTTDMPGCREAIEPGVTGILVPARDATALADGIAALLGDTERRRAMGAAGRALAEREFSVQKVVAEHLAVYQELASR